jgi:hypothetical protein
MAATKTQRQLIAAGSSIAANASLNASEWNLSTAYGGLLNVQLSLPGSAPTTVPTVSVYTGDATGKKYLFAKFSGSVTAGDYPMNFPVELPPSAMFANVTITNGATNGITAEAFGQELTGI